MCFLGLPRKCVVVIFHGKKIFVVVCMHPIRREIHAKNNGIDIDVYRLARCRTGTVVRVLSCVLMVLSHDTGVRVKIFERMEHFLITLHFVFCELSERFDP